MHSSFLALSVVIYCLVPPARSKPCLASGEACNAEYDVIVVGSGLVGSGVSSRLAELLPTTRILVLEGGGEGQWPRGGDAPAYWDSAVNKFVEWTGDWHGLTRYDVPAAYALYAGANLALNSYVAGDGTSWAANLTGWSSEHPWGLYCAKVLGGGATINGALMQQIHEGMFSGHPEFGLHPWPQSWNASIMEPYYQEVERLFSSTPTPSADGKHYLHESGPAVLKDVLAMYAPCNLPQEACGAYPSGFKLTSARKPASGIMGIPYVNAAGGIRQTTASLLQPSALSRQNYELSVQSEVTEILHKDGVATGVQYTHLGSAKSATLAKNGLVLLSAGAVGSPRLLLSSGIGDAKVVGKNLTDHGMTRMIFQKPGWNISAFEFPPSENVRASYISHQTGPLAQYGPVLTAFVRDPTTPGVQGVYDVEVFINPSAVRDELVVWYVLMRPTCSSASLHWNGTALHVLDDAMYLHCSRDIQTMQYARDVVHARMSAVGAACVNRAGDVCGPIAVNGTTKLRTNTYAVNHFAGSCPLEKCVDAETLLVHGSENVAVADASILPGQVWGHPVMTLEALAFRAADLLASLLQRRRTSTMIV